MGHRTCNAVWAGQFVDSRGSLDRIRIRLSTDVFDPRACDPPTWLLPSSRSGCTPGRCVAGHRGDWFPSALPAGTGWQRRCHDDRPRIHRMSGPSEIGQHGRVTRISPPLGARLPRRSYCCRARIRNEGGGFVPEQVVGSHRSSRSVSAQQIICAAMELSLVRPWVTCRIGKGECMAVLSKNGGSILAGISLLLDSRFVDGWFDRRSFLATFPE